ncbi:MAG TPA: hypothetical protein VK890_04085, partial [Bacteroidia bacterium]|nr:hypothetical protein [Bacteroidia bacterium]
MNKGKIYFILISFFFSPLLVWGVTNTATVSGAWETGTNWSQGHAPLAAEDVVVPTGLAMNINAADVCLSLTINGTGSVTINGANSLSIAGNFSNAGTFTAANAGSTLTFNAAVNSTVTGAGTYTIAGTIVLNMGAAATALDVQSSNFISGINTGGNYYFTFTRGTWRMDNAGTLNDCYNSGSNNALTINFGSVIESDNGTMNLAKNGTGGNVLLEGKLYLNGGTVTVQTGQALNSGQDFQYKVNGGTPQLYLKTGTLNVGAGFNYNGGGDYIDFEMTGNATMQVTANGYTNANTFVLNDQVGGITVMTAGTIIIQDACASAAPDLDMGGPNVKATLFSVTGGTVQFGDVATQGGATFYGVNAEPANNYPSFDFEAGTAKYVGAWVGGNINIISLNVNANMEFDCSGYGNVTVLGSNGVFALNIAGTLVPGSGVYTFSGSVNQLITSSLGSLSFNDMVIANTGGATTSIGGSLTSFTTNNFTLQSGTFTEGTLNTLNINASTTLTSGTFNATGNINVLGNWTNNGATFNAGTSTVSLYNSLAQTIGGTSSTTFYNLVINNSSGTTVGVTQNVNTNVSNVLTMSNGTYFLNGHTLTLQNNSNGAISGGSASTYIVSENTSMNSVITWHNISKTLSSYVFPFGINNGGTNYYLPFTFNITGASGVLGDVSLATYETGANNTPFAPGVTQVKGKAGSCYPGVDETQQAIVDRWWQITAATSPTATITFTYAGPEAATMTANPACGTTLDAYHWNAGTGGWDVPVGNQTVAVTANGSTGSVTAAGVSTFSPWLLGLFASPLPITLVSFDAQPNDLGNVNCTWTTESQINNKVFTIERSADGNHFDSVTSVPGAGTTSQTLSYSAIDENPFNGTSYYRLKQTDYDGHYSFSDIVPVNISSKTGVSVFPNP